MALILSAIAAIATLSSRPLIASLPTTQNELENLTSNTMDGQRTAVSPVPHSKASQSQCPAGVLPYSSLRYSNASMYSLHIESTTGGELHYFGVIHTNDPQHPQFEQLEQDFYQVQPTIVFYEGPARSLPDTRNRAIEDAGDPGLIRHLATQHHIPIAQLEPSRQAEIDILLERFTPEQVKLFYVLRQVAELREVWNMTSKVELQQAVIQSIDQLSAFDGLKTVITNLEDFETSYQKHWQTAIHWWHVPRQWFHPVLTVEETGGIFTNDMHRIASTFRNQHMVQVLSDAVNQGHRVMASVGKGHLPLQSSALECLIQ